MGGGRGPTFVVAASSLYPKLLRFSCNAGGIDGGSTFAITITASTYTNHWLIYPSNLQLS